MAELYFRHFFTNSFPSEIILAKCTKISFHETNQTRIMQFQHKHENALDLTLSLPRVIFTDSHPVANSFGNVVSDSEGKDGSFIVRRTPSAIPRNQKVTLSRHMVAPKLRFSHGLKAKGPGAVMCTARVPAPTSGSSKILQAQRPSTEHKKQRW